MAGSDRETRQIGIVVFVLLIGVGAGMLFSEPVLKATGQADTGTSSSPTGSNSNPGTDLASTDDYETLWTGYFSRLLSNITSPPPPDIAFLAVVERFENNDSQPTYTHPAVHANWTHRQNLQYVDGRNYSVPDTGVGLLQPDRVNDSDAIASLEVSFPLELKHPDNQTQDTLTAAYYVINYKSRDENGRHEFFFDKRMAIVDVPGYGQIEHPGGQVIDDCLVAPNLRTASRQMREAVMGNPQCKYLLPGNHTLIWFLDSDAPQHLDEQWSRETLLDDIVIQVIPREVFS